MGGWELRRALLDRGIQVEATASHYSAIAKQNGREPAKAKAEPYADGKRRGRDDIIVQCTELTTEADADALALAVTSLARSGERVAAR